VGKKSNIDGQIALLATARGLIGVETLRSLGLTRQAIAARCRAQALVRVHQGVYFVGHAEATPLAIAEAAVLACGDRSALSHDSAGALWSLRTWPRVDTLRITWGRLHKEADELERQLRAILAARDPHARS
jgi:hypothetical protein